MATPEPSNVHPLRPGPDYLELLNYHQAQGEELAATRRALAAADRRATRLRRELDEERGQPDDLDETVHTILVWWLKVTGRPTSTDIRMTTQRAKLVRRKLKHPKWSPHDVCVALGAVMKDPWYVRKGKTDVRHVLGDEERAEHFLRLGRGS